jgi:hypothetical protein
VQADMPTKAESSEFRAACAVLGLSAGPSSGEAKAAFRARAALLHPDVHQDAGAQRIDAATAAMQQLNEAYQLVLESLVAGDPKPTDLVHRRRGATRRDTQDRRRSGDTADAAPVSRGAQAKSGAIRRYPRAGSRPGSVVVHSRRRRTQARREPSGGLAHVTLWYGQS